MRRSILFALSMFVLLSSAFVAVASDVDAEVIPEEKVPLFSVYKETVSMTGAPSYSLFSGYELRYFIEDSDADKAFNKALDDLTELPPSESIFPGKEKNVSLYLICFNHGRDYGQSYIVFTSIDYKTEDGLSHTYRFTGDEELIVETTMTHLLSGQEVRISINDIPARNLFFGRGAGIGDVNLDTYNEFNVVGEGYYYVYQNSNSDPVYYLTLTIEYDDVPSGYAYGYVFLVIGILCVGAMFWYGLRKQSLN